MTNSDSLTGVVPQEEGHVVPRRVTTFQKIELQRYVIVLLQQHASCGAMYARMNDPNFIASQVQHSHMHALQPRSKTRTRRKRAYVKSPQGQSRDGERLKSVGLQVPFVLKQPHYQERTQATMRVECVGLSGDSPPTAVTGHVSPRGDVRKRGQAVMRHCAH